MRLSTFNHYVVDYPEPGETLIHNTFTGAYVAVDSDVVEALRKADRGELLSADEQEMADDPDLSDPDVGIRVPSRAAEEAAFHAWFERNRHKSGLTVTLGLNRACNFDCPYCSQGQIMDGSVMSEATCDDTARWLVDRAVASGLTGIHIAFVGGEPLLHPGRLERIASAVKAGTDAHGLSFDFQLTTNGYFLDEAMLDRLIPLGLRNAQVTLDGDESTHSITRVSKKGEDTFARIFGHVLAASRRIRISINGNYQSNTIHGFEPLVRKLAEAKLPAGTRMRLTPALEGLSSASGVGSGSCTWSNSDTSQQLALYDAALAAGFDPPRINVIGPCEFHDRNTYAIDPDGTLHKCPGFLGHPEWGIGHVAKEGVTSRHGQLLSINAHRDCTGCSHRPNCAGGCVAAQWIAQGRTEGVNCEHSYFEGVKDDAAIRGYLLATSDSTASAVKQFPPPVKAANGAATQPRRSAALRVISA